MRSDAPVSANLTRLGCRLIADRVDETSQPSGPVRFHLPLLEFDGVPWAGPLGALKAEAPSQYALRWTVDASCLGLFQAISQLLFRASAAHPTLELLNSHDLFHAMSSNASSHGH